MTTTTIRKTVAQLLAEHAESLIPSRGDKAYTIYHGKVWEGILFKRDCEFSFSWHIVPDNGEEKFEGGDYPYQYKGQFKRGGLDTAHVDVYGPDTEGLDSWGGSETYKKLGKKPGNMVEYDVERGKFFLRACED